MTEYTTDQMQSMLAQIAPFPDLQLRILEAVTNGPDGTITDPQQIAAIMQQHINEAAQLQPAAVANPFAVITGLEGVVFAELRALNAPDSTVQVVTTLPAQQRDAGRDGVGGLG